MKHINEAWRRKLLASTTKINKAVIYCRVSAKVQEKKGDGLGSQEAWCREYAKYKGYEVVEVFRESLTGRVKDRPAMAALLNYLRKHKKEGRIVIIDDVSRFARGHRAHWPLRDELYAAGGVLESPSIEFGEDADSLLREGIVVTVAQHHRQKNAEQTRNRMHGRLLNGYWPFSAPLGFKHESKQGQGKVLMRREPYASIIQEVLEGYASGRFQTQTEVRRFLEGHPDFPKRNGRLGHHVVPDLLTEVLYAGYVEKPNWDVSLRKGQHDGLVSLQTFERIQQRLKEGSVTAARADLSEDFPLRGTIACAHCGKPLTSCWSTSKTGAKHPYYMCFAKGCDRYRKSIRRDDIEGEFDALLDHLTPSRQLFDLLRAVLKDAWDQRASQARAMAKSYERDIAKTENQVAALLDRIVEVSSDRVMAAFEEHIAKLERDKLLLQEKRETVGQRRGSFEQLFELAFLFLSSPSKIWRSGSFEHKKLVLRLTFADHLGYCPQNGFSNPKIALPFKVLTDMRDRNCRMAEGEELASNILQKYQTAQTVAKLTKENFFCLSGAIISHLPR
jgi:DNA invertase Pin-like site-specific DNA recombinase